MKVCGVLKTGIQGRDTESLSEPVKKAIDELERSVYTRAIPSPDI